MIHYYKGTPFTIETTSVSNGVGYIESTLVEIYRDNHSTKIGEYTRNYCSFAKETFYPFKLDDCWYALYSKDYTATRVAKLTTNEFIDWCGEEPDGCGFCPTEFYVPRYKSFESNENDKLVIDDFDNEYSKDLEEYYNLTEVNVTKYLGEFYCNYGFLSGCYWGDDGSWKLRYIDLSDIHNKNLKIDERFGYFELPYDRTLIESIRNSEKTYFYLMQLRHYNFGKNKFVDNWQDASDTDKK
jgi:hypothetical protein